MSAETEGDPFEAGGIVAEVADECAVAELLAEYCTFLAQQAALLRQAAARRRVAEVHRIAHAIRGGALTVHASALADVAENLEKVTKTGITTAIDPLVAEIDATVAGFARELDGRGLGLRV